MDLKRRRRHDREGARSLPSVELNIEELVLHGFPAGERRRIGDALEVELARLITEAGGLGKLKKDIVIHTMEGGAFHVAAGQKREATGAQIAQSIYGAIRQGLNSTIE